MTGKINPNQMTNKTYWTSFVKYHSSYDWLMPVVEKIENIKDKENCYRFSFDIGRDFCVITFNSLTKKVICAHSENHNKILSVYKAVIKFIKWYNETKS